MLNEKTELPKILAVLGPTASGKSALGIKLAQKFGGEIVSADSRQIYREMDIGTAKPSHEELEAVPHHLIDIKDPGEAYNLSAYKKDALRAIAAIRGKGKLPILVGGTGLYAQAVTDNFDIPEVPPDPELRAKLEEELKEKGLEKMFASLVEKDPEAAYIVDPRNPRRVVRALEVVINTGIPFTAQRNRSPKIFNTLKLGLFQGWDELNEKMDRRVDLMMEAGLLEEVRQLLSKWGRTEALDAIGYRELLSFLDGKTGLPEAVQEIKANTRAYAKRQMTWFKKDKEIVWLKSPDEADRLVKDFLA